MKTKLLFGLCIALGVYGLIVLIRWQPQNNTATAGTSTNVAVENGTQYIDLTAKGGYAPRKTMAKAGLPTVLRVTTNGTYDCSSSIVVPQAKVSMYLPDSGVTPIDLGTPVAGITSGTCGMGMYNFEIEFQS